MSQDPKFQQLWDFRKRDDEIDSSSDDPKSASSGRPALKKHKFVSNFIWPQDDNSGDNPRSQQQNGQHDPGTGVNFKVGETSRNKIGPEKKTNAVKNRKRKNPVKEGNKKKSKQITEKSIPMDDLKMFMASVLEELKVERESMFARMREEMKKLVTVESSSMPKREKGSCVQKKRQVRDKKTRGCYVVSSEKSVISDRKNATNDCDKVFNEKVNHDQSIETITPKEKNNGENSKSSVKKTTNLSPRSDQIVSSSYLTLPLVLPEPVIEQHRIDSSSKNFSQLDTNVNSERANVVNDANTDHGYFMGIQADDQFGSFAHVGSKNMGFYDQHITQTSTISSGFPVPLHHRLDNGFNIPSQVVMENPSRGNNNVSGLRMNGGANRFSGGNHALPDHLIANNFHGHMNYKPDGGFKAVGKRNINDGHLYPN